MTLPRFAKLLKYWQDEPPTHVILGARYGLIKAKPEVGTMEDLKREIAEHGKR